MEKTGIIELPLHYGKAPRWLLVRMEKLSREIFRLLVDEFGTDETVKRLSDPLWFQALACVLGFDWHSSGTTTVVTGVLKSSLSLEEHGIGIAGGKGKRAIEAQKEIEAIGEELGLSNAKINEIKKASRITAKVDNSLVQDGYDLYHHAVIISKNSWSVVQQGMNIKKKYARRYHWFKTRNFLNDPHSGIISQRIEKKVLNLASKKSEETRKACLDMLKENPKNLKRIFSGKILKECKEKKGQLTLTGEKVIKLPWKFNWSVAKKVYEIQPKSFEELLMIRGVGKATIRALALISEIIYGTEIDWKDPAKYSFAFGGKDGIPYPVNVKRMDTVINILRSVIEDSKVNNKLKRYSLKKLAKLEKVV